MYGEGFCASAKNCYTLVSRNMFSAVVVDVLGRFVLFVGKLLGTALCTIFTSKFLFFPFPFLFLLSPFVYYCITYRIQHPNLR